jgi:hypothetical protein
MTIVSKFDLSDSTFGFLERKRHDFWRAHSDWTEQRRQAVWKQQTTHLANRLHGSSAATGDVDQGLGYSSAGLDGSADQAWLVRGLSLG